ncbi:MAG: hypothetical protein EZS28_021728 [Streblomastix strix]|uniref:Uncharacterized protein n=1 Tax=Streblomastix strix TaxID=222440 RepID=A0A5J4VJF0_9EUKA|nr:MAG: hypothetical protein EZS28_021728 [Streblomastix strix]
MYCLQILVQPHSLDCLFVITICGERLLLQWNKTRFYPLATRSLLKAIQQLNKTPEKHSFYPDSTLQWAVSIVSITDNSPRFFIRLDLKSDWNQIPVSTKPIIRNSFRAVIVIDGTVFAGVKYDGHDANFLSVIKNN